MQSANRSPLAQAWNGARAQHHVHLVSLMSAPTRLNECFRGQGISLAPRLLTHPQLHLTRVKRGQSSQPIGMFAERGSIVALEPLEIGPGDPLLLL